MFTAVVMVIPVILVVVGIVVLIVVLSNRKPPMQISYSGPIMVLDAPGTSFHVGVSLLVHTYTSGTTHYVETNIGVVEGQSESQVRVAMLGNFRHIDADTVTGGMNGPYYKRGDEITVGQVTPAYGRSVPVKARIVQFYAK